MGPVMCSCGSPEGSSPETQDPPMPMSMPEPDASIDAVAPDAPRPAEKLVFVTSATFYGDLAQTAGTPDGITGADKLCTEAAGWLGGEWVAWVSSSASNAIDRIPDDGGPWFLANGSAKIFSDKASIVMGPQQPILITEQGTTLTTGNGSNPVWTATNAAGEYKEVFNTGCDGFTSSSAFSVAGLMNQTAPGWTEGIIAIGCNNPARLYCFER
ncbi:MAG: hypothetical protein AB7R00_17115 [Kofleriaceae bacterium]